MPEMWGGWERIKYDFSNDFNNTSEEKDSSWFCGFFFSSKCIGEFESSLQY
jgi:hypothetical protein